MKLISLLVALCFSLNVFAGTGTIQQFEKALDDYHYAMSVEWDQKDAAFFDKKSNEFFKSMQTLMSESGLTQSQVLSVMEKKIKNKTQFEALKLKLSLMSQARSTEDLAGLVRESSSELYSSGASWNGNVMVPVYIAVGAIAALGFAMWYSATHGCQEYAQTCDWAGCRNNYDECVDHGYVGPHL